MYRCSIYRTDKINQYEELIKVFLQPGEYEISGTAEVPDDLPAKVSAEAPAKDPAGDTEKKTFFGVLQQAVAKIAEVAEQSVQDMATVCVFDGDKDAVKRQIYRDLKALTGKQPKWGILTGIRPVKMAGELVQKTGSAAKARQILLEDYLMSPEKADLVLEIYRYQQKTTGAAKDNSLSLYLGIPFCPTRCLYCSFTSNQVKKPEIDRYLEALFHEIAFAAENIKEDGYEIESLYIGGGTPTTLDEAALEAFLQEIQEHFDLSHLREFTVEAGRPDTITEGKLRIMEHYGVDRISINPQTMKQDTLDLIGRAHTVDDVEKAFALAKKGGPRIINTDLIAGLPGEDFADFKRSLDRIVELGAENITLHTLAVKRASRLKEMDGEFNYRNEDLREEMLSYAMETLRAKGYRPYYLYRQKHTSGNTENIGFCRDDAVSVYNIRIMEEAQSILALGAGGISKIWFPAENRLERVANVSNYEIYIDRLDEMMERKKNGFFGKNRWR